MDPRVIDALTIASLAAGGPEVGTAAWLARIYLRTQVLQLIAMQGAARQVRQQLPRELTKARVPSVQELRKHLETAVADGAERGLDLLGIQRPRASSGLWATFQAVKRVVIEPALLLAPTHEAAQRGVAPIERTSRQVFLCGEEYGGCLMRQASDRLLAVLGDKRGEVLSVALTCSGSEARARQEALQCGVEVRQRWNDL